MAHPMPGGFTSVDVDNETVQAAGLFAAAELNQGALEKILNARVQVVAGRIYLLEILVKPAQGGEAKKFRVKVFKPLGQAPMELMESNQL